MILLSKKQARMSWCCPSITWCQCRNYMTWWHNDRMIMMRICSSSNQLDIYSRLNAEAWTCTRAGLEEISSSVNNNLKNHGYYGCLVLVMVMYGWQCSGWHLSLCNSWCRVSGVGQHESWVLLSLHARLQPLVEQSAGPGPGIRWGVGALLQWLESLRWRSVGRGSSS